jgi:hypothetical protein
MTTTTTPRPLPRTDYPTDRAAIAAGYRHLADLIESEQAPIPINPEVSLFLTMSGLPVDDEPAAARDLMRALGGGKYAKDVQASGGSLILRGMCGGLPVDVWVTRDAVCERVVVGCEEVTEVVPAVTEADLRPEQTITRTVEHVEWRCAPLLAAAETADAVEVSA